MRDSNLSIHHVVAGLLWLAAAGLIIGGGVTGILSLGHLGLMCAGAAMVGNIRGFICVATRQVMESERNAFELGRDSADLRRIR